MIAVLIHPQVVWAQVFWIVACLVALAGAWLYSKAHAYAPVAVALALFFVALGLLLVF